MEVAFSTSWNSSVQPRKQRKYRHNAPLHTRGKFVSAHLSKELAKKYNIKSARIRVGDKVKVMRGTHKGKEGKVEKVDIKNLKIIVSKIETKKLDGSTTHYPLVPSNLMITSLVDDKKRFKALKSSTVKNTSKKDSTKEAPAKTTKTTNDVSKVVKKEIKEAKKE